MTTIPGIPRFVPSSATSSIKIPSFSLSSTTSSTSLASSSSTSSTSVSSSSTSSVISTSQGVVIRRNYKSRLAALNQVEDNTPIIDVATKYPPPGWEDVFKDSYEELKQISDVIAREQTVIIGSGSNSKISLIPYTPHTRDIFKAFWMTPLDKVRVVIYGQDPYPGWSNDDYTAQGYAFGVRRNDAIPPSLRNIYLQIEKNLGDKFEIPSHGDLTKWADQGVLLLNTALTCFLSSKNSHAGIWKPFIYKVISAIKEKKPNAIHVLWGKEAQTLVQYLGDSTILMASHPSPLSASRGRDAFFKSNHFTRINEILSKTPEGPIDWNLN